MASDSTSAIHDAGWNWDNTYARLPEALHSRVSPTPVERPHWIVWNRPLATALGLDAEILSQNQAAPFFAGNVLFAGSQPIAQAYAGHQFGNLTRLGDGRTILLGEHLDPRGRRWDIQLKGSGPTPYSRRGDGRAALAPMLREYLISEAMDALGIPTTRSLAVVTTGEPVFRETPQHGAVLTRVASSHLRVGTLELFAAQGDLESLRLLCRYALERHYPEQSTHPNPGLALLEAVMKRQVHLVAEWMRVGFVHGVLNTDNVALSGETLDYGPCAFMDAYDPSTVFSSIDHSGRYAFGKQPGITSWNLARLAEALLPVVDSETSKAVRWVHEVLETFPHRFREAWSTAYRKKLGLLSEESEDLTLIEDLLAWMRKSGSDFTTTFRNLRPDRAAVPDCCGARIPEIVHDWTTWHARWVLRLNRQNASIEQALHAMLSCNPSVIPRNHVVEAALNAAAVDQDLGPFQRLLTRLQDPYAETDPSDPLSQPPAPGTPRCQTFCGT